MPRELYLDAMEERREEQAAKRKLLVLETELSIVRKELMGKVRDWGLLEKYEEALTNYILEKERGERK